MNTFKQLYKQFFGLREATLPTATPDDVDNMNKMADAAERLKTALGEELVDEAKLVNNITDYRGGVEFVMRDPAAAVRVTKEIQQWAAKKGITLVKKQIGKTGRIVYLYFRLGEDPGTESQKIQGYLAQLPELKHFRFKVRGEQQPAPQPEAEPQLPARPIRKI
jgi:soluble cytochrome b562